MSFLRKMEKEKAVKKKTSSENQVCNSTSVKEKLGKKLANSAAYDTLFFDLLKTSIFDCCLIPVLSFQCIYVLVSYQQYCFQHFYYSNSFLF